MDLPVSGGWANSFMNRKREKPLVSSWSGVGEALGR